MGIGKSFDRNPYKEPGMKMSGDGPGPPAGKSPPGANYANVKAGEANMGGAGMGKVGHSASPRRNVGKNNIGGGRPQAMRG